MRVFLRVAYDGSNYHGWQYQEGQPTIQDEIQKALSVLVLQSSKSNGEHSGFPNIGFPIEIIGASRTDAGVHAYGNAAVFDTDSTIPPDRFSFALNNILPEDIRITESKEVPGDFNPRYDAVDKTYEYTILNTPVEIPLKRLYSYHYRGAIDVEAMNKGAKWLLGEHDFTSFSSVHAQVKSFVRTINSCDVRRENDEIIIRINGNGFLYNMVRIIAGTLLEVGIGKTSPDKIEKILKAKDRTKSGRTLPPQGLVLKHINYSF